MNEQREDQLVAALSHASVLMPLIGIAVPLAVWLSQRERSAILRFQALQAIVYQVAGLLLYVVFTGCQMVGVFGTLLILPFALVGSRTPSSSTSSDPVIGGIIALLFTAVTCGGLLLQCIGWPVYVIIAVRGAWQVLRGHTFNYPWLGTWLARRTTPIASPPYDTATPA